MASAKKMDAFLGKDISQMSYEELEKAARHYGLDENSKVDLVQIDGLVPHIPHHASLPHPQAPSRSALAASSCTAILQDAISAKDRCRR
jgi:hypothetical protein